MSKDDINESQNLPPKLVGVLKEYSKSPNSNAENEENDSAVTSAVWYEKIRAAVEYQESHLMFKNSVFRILQRNILLNPKIRTERLFNTLVSELVWANYITPKTLDEKKSIKVSQILHKYLKIIKRANSVNRTNTDIVRYLAGLCACDIEEEIFSKKKRAEKEYLDFVYSALVDNFQINELYISKEDHVVQLKMAIYINTIKPDIGYSSYYALKLFYPTWRNMNEEEALKITKSIDPFISSFERCLYSSYKNKYLLTIRNMAAPFLVLRTYLLSSDNISEKGNNQKSLEYKLFQAYDTLRIQSNNRIWRGIWRALIFLLVSKMTLAFIIEIPVDRAIHGEILWMPLIANIALPPLLMLIAGASIPKIPTKNSFLMKEAISEIVNVGKLKIEKPVVIERKKQNRSTAIFNYLLSFYSLAILAIVVWLLCKLKFSVVSIILFFIFISAVSFLAFRIRVNSKELLIKRKNQDSITTLIEFFFLPFITLGKIMSDRLTRLNPMLLAIDFIIEAPFKTIIKILRTWFSFVSSKKEEMEY